jgi:hypothetical protein
MTAGTCERAAVARARQDRDTKYKQLTCYGPHVTRLTRRELFRLVAGSAVLAHLPACGDDAPSSRFFTSSELDVLRGFADAILPPDAAPGGSQLGAVAYIEGLLAAFDHMPPKIFAGGPFSDRNALPGQAPPPNAFAEFIELDRVSDAAWRPYVTDLHTKLKDSFAAVAASSSRDYKALFDGQSDEFKSLMIDLVCEAAFAAPEYGGNPKRAGWDLLHFEGDTQPLGFTQWNGTTHVERAEAPFSTANPSDPDPLTQDVHDVLTLAITVLGGRVKA